MQGEKEDDGKAGGGNTEVDDEDKDGNVCVVVVLVATQVEDTQGEYANKGECEGNMRGLSSSRHRATTRMMARTMARPRTTTRGSRTRPRTRTPIRALLSSCRRATADVAKTPPTAK